MFPQLLGTQNDMATIRLADLFSVPYFRVVRCLDEVGAETSRGQAVLGRQHVSPTPWLTGRQGHDPDFVQAAPPLVGSVHDEIECNRNKSEAKRS